MPNVGISPPDFASERGQVRMLLGDTDAVALVPPVAGQGEYSWFSDAEIDAMLILYGGNVWRSAARFLITIAGSQALLLKKWSADDLSVDGAAISEALRKLAFQLGEEADRLDTMDDIFIISYPGRNVEFVPEGMPVPPLLGRVLSSGYYFVDDNFDQDGGILWDP